MKYLAAGAALVLLFASSGGARRRRRRVVETRLYYRKRTHTRGYAGFEVGRRSSVGNSDGRPWHGANRGR